MYGTGGTITSARSIHCSNLQLTSRYDRGNFKVPTRYYVETHYAYTILYIMVLVVRKRIYYDVLIEIYNRL